ncbi:hypothetical protein GWN49_02950 [Candidatus Bathyarchaeota archaeon]|nr:hypothetical protein [Candidatus Bathyarchaeota archaeon]
MKKDVSSLRKFRIYVWPVLALLVLASYSTRNVLGQTYDYMILQSNLSTEAPGVVLQNGTDNVSLVYLNDTSARIAVNATLSFATYNYTLDIVNTDAGNKNAKLEVFDSSNINRVSNATIILHNNSSSSTQITIVDGSITQTSGEYYSLSTSSTIHVKIQDLKESADGNSYFHTYLRIQEPNTTTYTLYTITFEFT